MRGTIIVQTQADYDKWMASQQTYYAGNAPGATAPAATPTEEPKKDSLKKQVTMK